MYSSDGPWLEYEVSKTSGRDWAERSTQLPTELVDEFLRTFVVRVPTSFAVTMGRLFRPSADTSTARITRHQVGELGKLVTAGARGFELIVGTSRPTQDILAWLAGRGYVFATSKQVDSGDLFERMFPAKLLDRTLQFHAGEASNCLVAFAHDADPIWIARRA